VIKLRLKPLRNSEARQPARFFSVGPLLTNDAPGYQASHVGDMEFGYVLEGPPVLGMVADLFGKTRQPSFDNI
jgi:hypothetical protein